MRKGKRVLFYSLLEDSGFTLMLEAREVVNCGLSSRGGASSYVLACIFQRIYMDMRKKKRGLQPVVASQQGTSVNQYWRKLFELVMIQAICHQLRLEHSGRENYMCI